MKIFLDDTKPPPGSDWIVCRTVDHAVFLLSNPALERVQLISMDYDLAHETAYDLIERISGQVKDGMKSVPKLVIHSANPSDRKRLEDGFQMIDRLLQSP
jgi:hypothetical protein